MILERIVRPDGTTSFESKGFHLTNLHAEIEDCRTYGCAVHNPTMTDPANAEGWSYNWRADRGIMERLCPCGIGHPDLDSARYFARIGRPAENVHGCCGCCSPTPAAHAA